MFAINIPATARRRMSKQPRSSSIIVAVTLALIAACAGEPRKESTPNDLLVHPTPELLAERAPDTVRVRFETTKGPFVVEAYRAWAPNGVDRFYQLARHGFYDGDRFFRVLTGFMAQFGLSGDPNVTAAWQDRSFPDDPVKHSNVRGTITFAMRGVPNSRTTQLFVNYRDNSNLDGMGFAPFGVVTEGMAVVDSLYAEYGEGFPGGPGPDQERASAQGNAYLQHDFPKLDYITKATVLTPPRPK
jgi:peptidyl-prolyl cis-trans isomerase A (cyclophilin A)